MSASSKKKLRREQEAAKMTEKQLAAQKEAKKLNLYTTAFVITMAVILVIAVTVGVSQTIASSGIREKNTVALTVGEHKISNAEMNYFYMDAVNNFYSQYGSYASLFGLDVTKPLDEQFVDEESGKTWADDFLDSAKNSAQTVYAMADAAEAAGYSLSNEELTAVEYNVHNMDTYATMYGYPDGETYLKAMYGNGATKESFLEYAKRSQLAQSYYNHYAENLSYDASALQAKDAEAPQSYSAYSYNSYYLPASRFLTGGTTAEDGTTVYTDEEKSASVTAAEAAAKSLLTEEITTVEALDAAIAALEINAGTTAVSTAYDNTLYSNVSGTYADWITDSSRVAGDMEVFASTSGDTVSGYYVIFFKEATDNAFPLVNVRHILISYQHDHSESEEHDHTSASYTDEEKAAAKAAAEDVLAQWEAGDKTEESFAALVADNSTDTGSVENGGLYEDIYPGQMVPAFNDWCFDSSRKSGDTGIVETEYGYHVMYFAGNSDVTYRNYLIENDLRTADLNSWYASTVDAMTVTDGQLKYLDMGLVLSPAA